MIAKADIRRAQEWMGHADAATTMKYLHYVERPDEAELVAAAFAVESPASGTRHPAHRRPAVSQSRRARKSAGETTSTSPRCASRRSRSTDTIMSAPADRASATR
jgi:hypothetical protein